MSTDDPAEVSADTTAAEPTSTDRPAAAATSDTAPEADTAADPPADPDDERDVTTGTTTDQPRRWTRIARYTVFTLLLTAVGYLGGIGTTALWPITVETAHYRAEVSISPGLSTTSTVRAPTVFGDISLNFAGPLPAPGVEARVQVREEITQLFTTGYAVDTADLTPDAAEIQAALREGLRELAIKFAAGVLVTELLILGVWFIGRGRFPHRRLIASAGIAALAATTIPAATAGVTYRQENFASFDVTSLLGTVHDNVTMLDDIQGASQQATPYIYNLLALSEALQNEFVPEEARGEPAARFLLVSDIHGMNYYALMERIIAEEDITAVIDAGDLLNWGLVEEGEMAGIYDSIEALGVPYIFVRGNHDANGPRDEAVLQRMAQIPNVILLEPTDAVYQEAQINGVRVVGFNDWRYWGEELEDYGAQQDEAAARFREATEDWPLADIVVSHQPYAVRSVPSGGVQLAGHMHTAGLTNNLVQLGTFTGGGLVNHFQVRSEEEDDTRGELSGAPYAFDILNFGEDCSIQSLTRYTYRNLVLGRPQYDGVSVINGARLADPPEDRSCGPAEGVSTVPIEPATGDEESEGAGEQEHQGAGPEAATESADSPQEVALPPASRADRAGRVSRAGRSPASRTSAPASRLDAPAALRVRRSG